MYYDLITSLPHLRHFQRAERLPITPLRLQQRLTRLRPQHAEQLNQARAILRWHPEKVVIESDAAALSAYKKLIDSTLVSLLRDYTAFRLTQQTLLAALRRRRDGLQLPEPAVMWGVRPHVHCIRRSWNEPTLGLEHLYPWLRLAHERAMAGDAIGMERLLMDLNWRWLTNRAQSNIFGFEAVCAYVFKWDMLQAWLVCSADRARIRFRELVDKVTQYEQV